MWKIALVLVLFIILASLFTYKTLFIDPSKVNVESPVVKGSNAIYVTDQPPAPYIVINEVLLSKKGYVVIYEDNQGKLGNIIGNTKIMAEGRSKNVIAGLIRPTIESEALFAILSEDSGDGIFSPGIDIPIKDEEGNVVSVRFSIDQNAPAP